MSIATTSNPRHVRLPEAARLFSVHPKTLRRRISDGTITGYRLGPRTLFVDLDELEAALRPIPTRGNVA